MVFIANGCVVQHVAVECDSQEHAERFFSELLGLPKVKSTLLSKELSVEIFGIGEDVRFDFYAEGTTRFEVFISQRQRQPTYAHVCIEVDDKDDFVLRCRHQGLEPFFVDKDGKQLLFVRDYSGNLYEIK